MNTVLQLAEPIFLHLSPQMEAGKGELYIPCDTYFFLGLELFSTYKKAGIYIFLYTLSFVCLFVWGSCLQMILFYSDSSKK